jgi:hypothetical protein
VEFDRGSREAAGGPDAATGRPDRPDRELGELLSLVAPVESYWAVPWPQHLGELRALVAAGDFELASRIAEPIAAEHGYVTGTACAREPHSRLDHFTRRSTQDSSRTSCAHPRRCLHADHGR